MEGIKLHSGDEMPLVGFGTWQAPESELETATELALEAGYRFIDCARVYENEAAVGRALKKFTGGNPDKRKELFICTKLPPSGNRPEHVLEYFEASLKDLGLEYIDLYLMHVPFAFKHVPGDLHPKNPDGSMMVDNNTDILAVWKELEKLQKAGRIKNIGVSNFNINQIDRIVKVADVKPACNQVELHLFCQQQQLLKDLQQRHIPVIAYSPLGSKGLADMLTEKTGKPYPDLLTQEAVLKAAANHKKTPAQILLRYTVERGVSVIPKSTNAKRIKENITIFDFELTPEERKSLEALDRGDEGRICDFTFFPGVLEHPEYPFKK